MTRPAIFVRNIATCVPDAAVLTYLPALQKAIDQDFAPAWGLAGADLDFVVDPTLQLPNGIQAIVCADHSDQAGALGYHDTRADGTAIGFAFLADDIAYHEDWRTTLSHEVFELLRDPQCNSMALALFQGSMVETLYEVCDAVEGSSYLVDGQPVSDFVLPPFFDTFTKHPAGTRYDHCGVLVAPMTIAEGGYLSVKDPRDGRGWRQAFGQNVPARKRVPQLGTRRARFLAKARGEQETAEPSTAI